MLLERSLESPLDKEIKQSILKEINPKYLLEEPLLKLKLQYFGHLMQRAESLEKTLMLGKIEGCRIRGRQRTIWLDGITDSMDFSLSKLWEMVENRKALHASVYGVTKSRALLVTEQYQRSIMLTLQSLFTYFTIVGHFSSVQSLS